VRQWQSHHLLLPKTDATLAECEDVVGRDDGKGRYAVVDGATEAFDARGWATHLAHEWISAETLPQNSIEFLRWARMQGETWHAGWQERKLSWFAEEKRRAGSFAAFVGLTFEERDEELRWRAVAIGDACLVIAREGKIQSALPIADYQLFNSTPRLLPSLAADERLNERDVCIAEGAVVTGDVFWLLSDALAQWCLHNFAEKALRVAEFERLLTSGASDALAEFIEAERREARLRDDDVAALLIS
jgi:hypothetical protein